MVIKRLFVILGAWLCILSTQAQANYYGQKVSGYLRSLAQESKTASGDVRRANGNPASVCALMKVNASADAYSVAAKYQCKVMDNIGDIYILQIPVNQLEALSLDDNVLRVEAHEMPKPTMNDVPARIGVDMLHIGGFLHNWDWVPAFTGKGVITGVVDFGFDFRHPMFLDSAGVTRVCQFYDMTKNSGEGTRGIVYPKDSVIAMKHSPLAVEQYHGTNVASVMAGSKVYGERDTYVGIAPESDIVMAEINMQVSGYVTEDGKFVIYGGTKNNADGTTADLLLAIKRIFDYADLQQKPCVVNFSGGMMMPLLDPCILENEALGQLQGPGRIIVVGAGNDGSAYGTMEKKADQYQVVADIDGNSLYSNSISKYVSRTPECHLVSNKPQQVRFFIKSNVRRDSTIYCTLELNTDTLDLLAGDTCLISAYANDTVEVTLQAFKFTDCPHKIWGNLYQFNIFFDIAGWPRSISQWNYDYDVKVMVESDSYCELFTYPLLNPLRQTDNPYTGETSDCINHSHTIAWPAESEHVIAVGAITSRNHCIGHDGGETTIYGYEPGKIAPFSSQGPTWDGTLKPDIVAPGVFIAVAANGANNKVKVQQSRRSLYDVLYDYYDKPEYITAESGTSLASPIVAGVIALWLQAKPDLTIEEIKDVWGKILRYKRNAAASQGVWLEADNIYGYGEINAYAGLLEILDLPSAISELSLNQPKAVRFQLSGRVLSVVNSDSGIPFEGQATIRVYTTDGKLVATNTGNSIDLTSLPAGVYAVQFNSQKKECSGSTLIRL